MGRGIAIIGAGPAGLAALKAAQEEGLEAVAFEARAECGGLWSPDDGLVWRSLKTNLSRYTCGFSDHPHDPDSGLFPSAARMAAYLRGYARAHDLTGRIRHGHRVVAVTRAGAGWRLIADAGGRMVAYEADAVIVASGVFAQAALPPGAMLGVDERVSHAASYRGPEDFAGRRVVVVGGAFSGADIAAEISGCAADTVMLIRRPAWYVPRLVPAPQAMMSHTSPALPPPRLPPSRLPPPRLPMDLVVNARAEAARARGLSPAVIAAERHAWLRGIVGDQGLLHPLLQVPDDGRLAPMVISDAVPDAIRSGRLRVMTAAQFDARRMVLHDGRHDLPVDDVIYATGYAPRLEMLPADVRAAVGYDPDDRLQPVLLAQSVFPDGIPGMAFVGMYRGPYFGVMDLQARWAAGVLSGRLPAPDRPAMDRAMAMERAIRDQRPRPQFPHADYPDMCDALAARLDVMPDLDQTTTFGRFLWQGPVLPAHYRLRGAHARPAGARAVIAEVAALFGHDLRPQPVDPSSSAQQRSL
ncbi:NAD(P)-binding domain-containing protein [Tistrella sp. BH-R2-4]|uniref:Trimethylamine monooxygenase n=1 Tax=Tistrella arctica TaxID=3133430 RepID=A0ABU9YSK8_9PROT